MKLTAKIIRELIDYTPETGIVIWRYRGRKWFKSDRDFNRWNNRFAGKPAGSESPDGYIHIKIFDVGYPVEPCMKSESLLNS